MKVPFVRIKRKLIKSQNFSASYEAQNSELSKYIFDYDFCTFLINLSDIYLANSDLNRVQ